MTTLELQFSSDIERTDTKSQDNYCEYDQRNIHLVVHLSNKLGILFFIPETTEYCSPNGITESTPCQKQILRLKNTFKSLGNLSIKKYPANKGDKSYDTYNYQKVNPADFTALSMYFHGSFFDILAPIDI